MATGLCQCGCGLPVKLAPNTDKVKGWVKGEPKRFRLGHRVRKHPIGSVNYPYRAINGQRRKWHLAAAEKALGKPLPKGAQVHHVDGSKRPTSQLVICESDAYHKLLHARTRIVRAGASPETHRMCGVCGPQPIAAFTTVPRFTFGVARICKSCANAAARARRAA